ncbi:hypothetical protein [Schleiferilactobacillus harbinensis]|uniref:hypothetical protein n=1 Tax=Schleiferilactobacillus harbinensis TaxID=304207 RepID=UPI0039EB98EC
MDVTIRNAVPADEAAVIRMWAAARARVGAAKKKPGPASDTGAAAIEKLFF